MEFGKGIEIRVLPPRGDIPSERGTHVVVVEAAEEVTGAFIAIGEEAGSTDTGEATLRIGAF